MPHSPRKDWTGIKWTCSVCGKRYVGRWDEPGEDRHVDYGHGQRTLPGFAELGLTQPTKPPVVPRKLRARRPYQVTQRTCSAKCARARKTERQKMRREAARVAAANRPHPRQRALAGSDFSKAWSKARRGKGAR